MSAGNRFIDAVMEAAEEAARERDPIWRVAERVVALRESLGVYLDGSKLYGHAAHAHGPAAVSRRLVDLHALWLEILGAAERVRSRPLRRDATNTYTVCAACAAGRCSCTADPESTDPIRNSTRYADF